MENVINIKLQYQSFSPLKMYLGAKEVYQNNLARTYLCADFVKEVIKDSPEFIEFTIQTNPTGEYIIEKSPYGNLVWRYADKTVEEEMGQRDTTFYDWLGCEIREYMFKRNVLSIEVSVAIKEITREEFYEKN
jgi:hypothetical protein